MSEELDALMHKAIKAILDYTSPRAKRRRARQKEKLRRKRIERRKQQGLTTLEMKFLRAYERMDAQIEKALAYIEYSKSNETNALRVQRLIANEKKARKAQYKRTQLESVEALLRNANHKSGYAS